MLRLSLGAKSGPEKGRFPCDRCVTAKKDCNEQTLEPGKHARSHRRDNNLEDDETPRGRKKAKSE